MTVKLEIEVLDKDASVQIELDDDGHWEPRYRLRVGDTVTQWGSYQNLYKLGNFIAISPYYTEHDSWVLVTPEQAIEYMSVTYCDTNIDHWS